MQPVISLRNVSKSFGHTEALKDVSLSVNPGEIFGFLGPNGAGKTTTIRSIMDFIRPDSGSIEILQSNLSSVPNIKRDIGYFAAENQLVDRWNATQHIDFYRSMKQADKKAYSLLKELDLEPKVPVKHMSTGNRQKLGFILSLIGNPRLLILDEPTRGLDPLLQNEVYTMLRNYADSGGTVFFSSHNLSEVEHICTNVGVIRKGVIVADKSLADIRAMKTYIVSVTFKADGFKPPADKNLRVISEGNRRVVLKVKGDVTPLLKDLSQYDINDIEVVHASLEDVFMEYYK